VLNRFFSSEDAIRQLCHLFCSGFSLMGANLPRITIGVYNRAAAIDHRALAGGADFGRFVDDLVNVFYIDEETGRRRAPERAAHHALVQGPQDHGHLSGKSAKLDLQFAQSLNFPLQGFDGQENLFV